jgi:hypothetical protein
VLEQEKAYLAQRHRALKKEREDSEKLDKLKMRQMDRDVEVVDKQRRLAFIKMDTLDEDYNVNMTYHQQQQQRYQQYQQQPTVQQQQPDHHQQQQPYFYDVNNSGNTGLVIPLTRDNHSNNNNRRRSPPAKRKRSGNERRRQNEARKGIFLVCVNDLLMVF